MELAERAGGSEGTEPGGKGRQKGGSGGGITGPPRCEEVEAARREM